MEKAETKAGDFTGLAQDYSKYRVGYCPSVLRGLIGLLDKPLSEVDFVDVGAGTGIWTRMVTEHKVKSATAIEPNNDMRTMGMADSANSNVHWLVGSAERTGLSDTCCDWLSMASSFHWADFTNATREFYRVLRPGGHFTALWNPRFIEANPILVEIEEYLDSLHPGLKRISSGRSGITNVLTESLWDSSYFEDVVYMEGRHVVSMSQKHYMGVWRSVNDLRVQLGTKKFDLFLNFVKECIRGMEFIEATYLTRAWSARRKKK